LSLYAWVLWEVTQNLSLLINTSVPKMPEIMFHKHHNSFGLQLSPKLPSFIQGRGKDEKREVKGAREGGRDGMEGSSLKFVALPVPEIIGVPQKFGQSHGYDHALFSPKFLMGFCSDGPFECSGQICNP